MFVAGAGSLAVEICASRLLAPYFGSSTVVWANLIGIVLAALALGYWLGGRVADRWPEPRLLGWIVAVAAALVAVVPFVARPLLDAGVEQLDEASAGAVVGSFLGVLALFAPPVILLGMVAPFAIRLALTGVETAGAVAGRLYALSTAGSLVGTFLSALVTIPLFGTQRTLLAVAVLLGGAASLLAGPRALVVAAASLVLAAVPPGAVKGSAGLLHEEESLYQYVQVLERPDGRRVLRLNEGVANHSVWRPGEVLTGGPWDVPLALPPLVGRPLRTVAILGNAGGTTARALGRYYPQARVDGVELDPVVTGSAGSGWASATIPGSSCTTPTRARSCGGRRALSTSWWSTPIVSPTSRSTSRHGSSSGSSASGWRRVESSPSTLPCARRRPARRRRGGNSRGRAATGGAVARAALQHVRRRARHAALPGGADAPAHAWPCRSRSPRDCSCGTRGRSARPTRPWTDDRAPVEWATDRHDPRLCGAGRPGRRRGHLPTRPR